MPQIVNKIAAAHPGKHGDCLYALPTVKALCEAWDCQADFYTSAYCTPLKTLFEYQSYIDKFYISPNYEIERMDMGCQPAYVPVDATCYKAVYQLGFARVPDQAIHKFIGAEVGIEVGDPTYEVPRLQYIDMKEPYLTLDTRGHTTYEDLFREVVERSPVPVLIVGGEGNYHGWGINRTGDDFLITAAFIKNSIGFIGLMSSQLVLANGFPIPKVIPHDGKSWDMSHVIYSDLHHYLIDPTAEEVLGVFDALLQKP